jgi:hypothetical protein
VLSVALLARRAVVPALLATVSTVSGAGCSDGAGPTTLTLSQLQGRYRAVHVIYRAVGDTSRHTDLVVDGGHRIHLQIADSTYHWTDSVPAVPVGEIAIDSGTIALGPDTLILRSDRSFETRYHVVLSSAELRLRDSLDTRIVCPGQCFEPTFLTIVMLRE